MELSGKVFEFLGKDNQVVFFSSGQSDTSYIESCFISESKSAEQWATVWRNFVFHEIKSSNNETIFINEKSIPHCTSHIHSTELLWSFLVINVSLWICHNWQWLKWKENHYRRWNSRLHNNLRYLSFIFLSFEANYSWMLFLMVEKEFSWRVSLL